MSHSNISIFIPHMGCPNACSFCNQRTISSTGKPPSAEDVTAILKDACPKLSAPRDTEIAFFGGSFTAIPRDYMLSLLEAAEPFLAEYALRGIRISTRPDKIDAEVLTLLKKYGVTSVELGAQSMRDEVLSANERGHTAEDVRRASALIREHGLELGLQMMTGLYRSSPDDDRYTAREIAALAPDTVRIYPTVILEGTRLAELYKSGEYAPIPFDEEAELCAELLAMFEENGIRVIRLGLHASESVGAKAVGGYYHPALGEICRSIIFRKEAEKRMDGAGEYSVYVSPKAVSIAKGQKKSNIAYFAEKGINVRIIQDESIPDINGMRVVKEQERQNVSGIA